TIAPINPNVKITISITGKETIVWNVSGIDVLGWVKYSPRVLSATTIDMIIGYDTAISHVRRNSIFKIKAIPKNMTKYNNIDTKILIILTKSLPFDRTSFSSFHSSYIL